MHSVQDVIARVRAEFIEMPGLQLTLEQIQRLCGIEARVCSVVLDSLVRTKFLCANANGTYARLHDESIAHAHLASVKTERALERRNVHVARRTA